MRLLVNVAILLLIRFTISAQEDFSNPQSVVRNHLENLQDERYFPNISARSFPENIDSINKIKLAKRLKQIYDGLGIYVQVARMPLDSNFLDSLSNQSIYYPYQNEIPQLYLEKIGNRWQYSEESAQEIPSIFRETYPLGMHRLVDMVPEKEGQKFLGIYAWQYVGIGVLLIISMLLYLVFSRVLNYVLSRTIWRSTLVDEEKKSILQRIDGYATLTLLAYLVYHLVPLLKLPIKFSVVLLNGIKITGVVFVALFILGMIDVFRSYLKGITAETESKLDEQLLPIVTKILKIVVVIIAIFRILNIINVNVTALIAGISIGGLALALAAQDTVKNFLGSMMIFFDKPFQIGDYIMSGEIEGSVVEVGFRSTRIKKPDTSIITVPNGKISDASLTNLGVRNMRMYRTTLGLMYNTPPAKIEAYIAALRQMIDERNDLAEEGNLVYLANLGASAIEIMFRVYILTNEYGTELQTKEDITFDILRKAEDIGVQFAFPSTSVYIEQMPK